jgi:rhamnosyltransferase
MPTVEPHFTAQIQANLHLLTNASSSQAPLWACVTCFKSTFVALAPLLTRLAPQVDAIVLVDNSPEHDPHLQNQARSAYHHLIYVALPHNPGTAGALNQAWTLALAQGAQALISFDQDSLPGEDTVIQLRNALLETLSDRPPWAALGPVWHDAVSGQAMRILTPISGWLRRYHAVPAVQTSAEPPIEVDHLISSGCITSAQAYQTVGPYNETLFLDYVDIEWCLRARALGLRLGVYANSRIQHSIGDHALRLGSRMLAVHSPMRSYCLLRNHLLLWRQSSVSKIWLVNDAIRVFSRLLALLVVAPQRIKRIQYLIRALTHAVHNRGGNPLYLGID